MKVGVVGLGLMGGSFSKAISRLPHHQVYGFDTNRQVMNDAMAVDAIFDEITAENIQRMDLILLCLTPNRAIEFVERNKKRLKTTVMDICGIKRYVEKKIRPIAKEYGFRYVGTHPMAGGEKGGFEYSKASLYEDAYMIVTDDLTKEEEELFEAIGFKGITKTTAQEHDRMIAYTSQLPHVMSNAFVKSPVALKHHGFSADSLKDLTRVARLDEKMWAELFLENKDMLLEEIEVMSKHLKEVYDCLENDQKEKLERILKEGSDRRKKMW